MKYIYVSYIYRLPQGFGFGGITMRCKRINRLEIIRNIIKGDNLSVDDIIIQNIIQFGNKKQLEEWLAEPVQEGATT